MCRGKRRDWKRQTVMDGIDCRDFMTEGLQNKRDHGVPDIADYTSISIKHEIMWTTRCGLPVRYLEQALGWQTRMPGHIMSLHD